MDTETLGLAQTSFLVMSWYLGTIEGKQVIKWDRTEGEGASQVLKGDGVRGHFNAIDQKGSI